MTQRMVMVTGVGGTSLGSGLLHALKRTQLDVRNRWRTLGTDADPFSWGLYVADEKAIVPLARDEGYLRRIQELLDSHDVAAILPGTESETGALITHNSEIPVPVIGNRPELISLMLDKFQAMAKLAEIGVPTIPTVPLERNREIIDQFGFPIVIKPTIGTGGSRELHLVADSEELERLLPIVSKGSKPCVQPYIGTPDAEYTVGILSDKDGQLIDSIIFRRKLVGLSVLREYRTTRGRVSVSTGISQGYIVREPTIQRFCEDLAEALGSTGPLNLQLRVHQDEIYVFEIHARFSGTTPIRASVGFNEPDVLLRNHLDGKRFGRLNFRTNVAAIRAFEHVLVPIDEIPRLL